MNFEVAYYDLIHIEPLESGVIGHIFKLLTKIVNLYAKF
jgi:hypothetical protein